jgi:hypothetical protein
MPSVLKEEKKASCHKKTYIVDLDPSAAVSPHTYENAEYFLYTADISN